MKRKILIIFVIIMAMLILFNINTSKATISGDYVYEVKSDGTIKIIDYNPGNTETNLNIPSTIDGKTVTEIDNMAFEYVEVENVIIPNTITSIRYAAFGNSKIKTITIPSTVTEIGSSTFINSELESVDIQANTNYLADRMFYGCKNLKKITLNTNIKSIYEEAFANCESLTDLSFLNTIENIGDKCFTNCKLINNVIIPNNIKEMSENAFDSEVKLDLSQTRLTKYENKYMLITKITLEGTFNYDKAYAVLDLVNKERKANGKEELIMDEELLENAMQRTAELAILYGHDRPMGKDYTSINDNMYVENIYIGPSTAESVMEGWISSQGSKENILSEGKSIGIGCFIYNGMYYWTQCFGKEIEKEAIRKENYTGTKDIYVVDKYIKLSLNTEYIRIKPNESFTIETKNGYTNINANNVKWENTNKEVATIDENGNIKGIINGITEIKAKLGPEEKKIIVFVQYFDDINKADWYTDSVNYCYNKGIILGTDTKYNPNTKLTRGMLVTILHRMEGKPEPKTENKFKDVYKALYYYDAIRWATEKGIVHGYEGERAGEFGPEDNVTRQDLAVILRNYAQYKGKEVNITTDLSNFSDSNLISDYAKTAVEWAVGKGVINGNDNPEGRTLTPHANSSRAEVAGMIYNYCTKVKDSK